MITDFEVPLILSKYLEHNSQYCRRRRNLPKKQTNADFKERIHKLDYNEDEFAGISNLSDADCTEIRSVS